MKDNPAMQYRNNVAAHALLIMLSAVIAFLGLMMLAQLTRSDLYAAHNIPPNAGWHSAGDSHDQNKLNQSPIKVLSADKLRSLLGSQALSGRDSVHVHRQFACPLRRPDRDPSATAILVRT